MRVPKLVAAAFILVNLLLLAASVLALRQNARLRGEVSNDEALLTPAQGTVMPPLTGADWTGAPRTIVYGKDPRSTIVYTFSRHCGYCHENWHAMRSFQTLVPGRLRIIYVDTLGELFTLEPISKLGTTH